MFLAPQILARSQPRASSGGGAHAAAFLARTSGLDGTHITAYTNLINGLDTDGLFSKLDVLHIYATQDSTTALLNLVSTSYNGTANGSPTFTTDRGYTGVENSSTIYIDTGFNPSTAPSPQFTQNSAHVSAWSVTSTGFGGGSIIGVAPGNTGTFIDPRNNSALGIFSVMGGSQLTVSQATRNGHYLANRDSSSAIEAFLNGSNIGSLASTSVGVSNANIYALSVNTSGSAIGSACQVAMASIGSSLSSTDATNFYNRLRTYMTAVGVP